MNVKAMIRACLLIFSAGVSNVAWSLSLTSINLCSDLIVYALANKSNILSVSAYTHKPKFSPIANEVQQFGTNHARASGIIATQPDLVVANVFSSPLTLEMLDNFDIPVYKMSMPQSLSGLYDELARFGRKINQAEKAQAVIQTMRQTLIPQHGKKLSVIYLSPNGYSFGKGTIKHELLSLAGFNNLTENLAPWHSISLEQVLALAPDVIITAPSGSDYDRANEWLTHPALQHISQHFTVPEPLWGCPSPHLLKAFKVLRAAHKKGLLHAMPTHSNKTNA